MMSYANDFVLAIINQGSPVREINNQIHLRFGSEYKIRLKNKNQSLRAKARVWVDGRMASGVGDIVLNPGQTLDLERFLDHDLNTGNKFQFVSLDNNKVNDPTDSSNGVIKVEFYRELQPIIFNYNYTPWTERPPFRPKPWPRKGTDTGRYGSSGGTAPPEFEITWNDNSTGNFNSNFFFQSYDTNSLIGSPAVPSNASLPGATVEGGVSNQKFVEVSDFTTEIMPTTLTLTIRGIQEQKPALRTIDQGSAARLCKNPQGGDKFCSGCGKRRSKMKDKYCSRCGQQYN